MLTDRLPALAGSLLTRARIAVCAASCVLAPAALAQVYKCVDPGGTTVYADAPCAAKGKPLRLQDPVRSTAPANPTACAQLLDETRRLASEAARDAGRGPPANAANAKRRQTLSDEYHRRCAGVSRAPD